MLGLRPLPPSSRQVGGDQISQVGLRHVGIEAVASFIPPGRRRPDQPGGIATTHAACSRVQPLVRRRRPDQPGGIATLDEALQGHTTWYLPRRRRPDQPGGIATLRVPAVGAVPTYFQSEETRSARWDCDARRAAVWAALFSVGGDQISQVGLRLLIGDEATASTFASRLVGGDQISQVGLRLSPVRDSAPQFSELFSSEETRSARWDCDSFVVGTTIAPRLLVGLRCVGRGGCTSRVAARLRRGRLALRAWRRPARASTSRSSEHWQGLGTPASWCASTATRSGGGWWPGRAARAWPCRPAAPAPRARGALPRSRAARARRLDRRGTLDRGASLSAAILAWPRRRRTVGPRRRRDRQGASRPGRLRRARARRPQPALGLRHHRWPPAREPW
jgi:hypothetical protein